MASLSRYLRCRVSVRCQGDSLDAFSFNYQLNLLKGRKKRINYNKKSELNTFNGGSWHYTRKVIDKEEYAKFLVPRPH